MFFENLQTFLQIRYRQVFSFFVTFCNNIIHSPVRPPLKRLSDQAWPRLSSAPSTVREWPGSPPCPAPPATASSTPSVSESPIRLQTIQTASFTETIVSLLHHSLHSPQIWSQFLLHSIYNRRIQTLLEFLCLLTREKNLLVSTIFTNLNPIMPTPSLKVLTLKVGEELLDSETGSEMVANHFHLPTISDVLHHFVHLQVSSKPPAEGDMLRFFN